MKKIFFGATALLMSGAAFANPYLYHGGDQTSDLVAAQAYWSVPPISDPQLRQAMVEAGLQHPAVHQTTMASNPDQWTGVGGPEEEPVTTVWPACEPGPGDDRCIQLYERGVRTAYAEWTATRSDTAMGGPDEDMDTGGLAASAEAMLTPKNPSMAMMSVSSPDGGTGMKDSAMLMQHPAPADPSVMTAEEMQAGSAWASHGGMSSYQGVGGPDEEPRVYPRCRSRSDDRCQQGS